MDWFPTLALRRKALVVTERLAATYHATAPQRGEDGRLPALDELILTLLSQSTTDVNSWRGYQALRERFPSWDAVADAPLDAVEATIRVCGLSRRKAPRLQAILRRVRAERGQLSLDFLQTVPPDEALAYLQSFVGVGRKTASCVLLFSLGLPAMPVDTHVLRVTRRLALIPPCTSAEQAHDFLEALLPEEAYLLFHVNVIAHGRQTCTARHPACARCPLLDECAHGQAGMTPEHEEASGGRTAGVAPVESLLHKSDG